MGLFLIATLIWGLIAFGIILFVWGLVRKSWKAFIWSGAALLAPAIMLATQKGLFFLFLAVPLAAFAAAYFTKKESR